MKKIYVAGKYSGDNVLDVLINIGRGEKACSKLFNLGYAVFSPWADRQHIYQNPDFKYNVDKFKKASMAWLEVSDAVYVVSMSGGVMTEIKRAKKLGIPVFYNLSDLLKEMPA